MVEERRMKRIWNRFTSIFIRRRRQVLTKASEAKPTAKKNPLKDFIYIDIPRIESFMAQLQRGLVKEVAEKVSGQKGLDAKLLGGIPGLQAELSGTGSITRAQETSKVLHDYLYMQLEEELKDQVIETTKVFSPEDWRSGVVHRQLGEKQNDFLKIRGRVRILDFASIALQLETVAKMMESFSRVQSAPPKTKQGKSRTTTRQQGGQRASTDDDPMTQLITLVKDFYGDLIILKVYPVPKDDTFYFTGALDKSYLQDGRAQMLLKFGTSPSVDWTVLAQVASVPPKIQQTQDRGALSLPELSANQFTDFSDMITTMLEAMGVAFAQTGITMSVKYPVISITPLAVYRD